MKNYCTQLLSSISFIALFTQTQAQDIEICLVTADNAMGTTYEIYWEQFLDISNIDSVIIYRGEGLPLTSVQIGAVEVGAALPTYFVDQGANMIGTTHYQIASRTNAGVIGQRSFWHKPVVLDYSNSGVFNWFPYEIEGQTGTGNVIGYSCYTNTSGTGFAIFNANLWSNTQTSWTDVNWASNPGAFYFVEATLPNCDVITKANINRSRSNIKQQFSNASASINENGISNSEFTILENPVNNTLSISFDQSQINGEIKIISITGKVLFQKVSIDANAVIDVSSFDAGAYYISFVSNKGATIKQFMKL